MYCCCVFCIYDYKYCFRCLCGEDVFFVDCVYWEGYEFVCGVYFFVDFVYCDFFGGYYLDFLVLYCCFRVLDVVGYFDFFYVFLIDCDFIGEVRIEEGCGYCDVGGGV